MVAVLVDSWTLWIQDTIESTSWQIDMYGRDRKIGWPTAFEASRYYVQSVWVGIGRLCGVWASLRCNVMPNASPVHQHWQCQSLRFVAVAQRDGSCQ